MQAADPHDAEPNDRRPCGRPGRTDLHGRCKKIRQAVRVAPTLGGGELGAHGFTTRRQSGIQVRIPSDGAGHSASLERTTELRRGLGTVLLVHPPRTQRSNVRMSGVVSTAYSLVDGVAHKVPSAEPQDWVRAMWHPGPHGGWSRWSYNNRLVTASSQDQTKVAKILPGHTPALKGRRTVITARNPIM